MRAMAFTLLLLPLPVLADGLKVVDAMVPLAPPTAMAHAAYFSLTNEGDDVRRLIGVQAGGYAVAHIHWSEIKNDIATMSSVDLVEIAPGQTVTFEHGGLHVMLMKPQAPTAEGDAVSLTLEFADGATKAVRAVITRLHHGGHGS